MSQKPLSTVILVDDSTLDNKIHQRIIQRTGLAGEVLSFSMAEDAIAHFRKADMLPADLVLLDINMPRMDGFEFLESATEEFGEVFTKSTVIMLTTSLAPQDCARAASFEVVRDYLQKPLTAEKFTRIVDGLQADAATG